MWQVLMALELSCVLGVVGGAILAGPFWLFGALAGAMYATPVGFVIGAIAGLRDWRSRCVLIACSCQFLGALTSGFGFAYFTNSGPPDWAFHGSIAGAIVGMIAAEAVRHAGKRLRYPLACAGCGYDLRGNVTPVCPECGEGVPADQMRLIEAARFAQESEKR